MSEDQIKPLSISELKILADKTMDLYIAALVEHKNILTAKQRQADLIIINKVITEKNQIQSSSK